jgi:DNA modification methylase
MISDAQLPELSAFRKVEAKIRLQQENSYAPLVVAALNETAAVHRWFRFKESFSPDLLKTVLDSLRPCLGRTLRMLDPFCGVGTSLVAAQELQAQGYSISATGIERNPFIAFVAKAKVNWPIIDTENFRGLADLVVDESEPWRGPLPSNSSISTARCITSHVARRLLAIRDRIRSSGEGPTNDALLLGLASAIEPLSRTRKDGRALRIVSKPRTTVAPVLRAKWNAIVEDVSLLQRSIGASHIPAVLHGDGRRPSSLGIQPGSLDLVFTSPPYPNNIDYTEVYKLELWLMGHVRTGAEFLQLRRQSFRSHPTSGLEAPSDDFMQAIRRGRLRTLLDPLVARIDDLDEPWRKRILLGYFSDVWTTLSECHRALRDGGRAVFIVGNSLHGAASRPYLVPTDLLLGAIAERLGFRVEHTIAARSLKRRLVGNHFLRESLIVLHKGNG